MDVKVIFDDLKLSARGGCPTTVSTAWLRGYVCAAKSRLFRPRGWLGTAEFDGFRAAADTVRGWLISRNGNRMQRFEELLDLLPAGFVWLDQPGAS